jgi:TatD DNase family protein
MVEIIDTHTHIFGPEFDADLSEVVARAQQQGVIKMLMPNVDLQTVARVRRVAQQFPESCIAMMGLHPCSVNDQFQQALSVIRLELETGIYKGVGEIGLDLHWDKTYKEAQAEAFLTQCRWAAEMNLPVSVHTREATAWALELLKKERISGLRGVFHCFTGSYEEGMEILKLGFVLGIGGVVTYKNTHLRDTLKRLPSDKIVVETDAPYLSPVPHRGKRNEPAYLKEILVVLSEVYGCSYGDISRLTSDCAFEIFKL